MDQGDALSAHWCVVIAALSAEYGWELNAEDVERYALALRSLLPDTCDETMLRRVCSYYHADHQLVDALRDSRHPRHSEQWKVWMDQVVEILRKAGLYWSSDSAVDSDDLAQVAQIALVASLQNFAYRSSFATWAHTVTVQSVRRHIRDSRAKKRAQRPESLDSSPDLDAPARDEDEPEQQALNHVLINQIHTIMLQGGDKRIAFIFHLWAIDDRSTEEIGKRIHLHPSRVRALLAQARTILQQHPAIQTWRTDVDAFSHE
ncbi:MAG: sigma-70 family RNA polymerase sigma factor [Chloroflexales bacterium]